MNKKPSLSSGVSTLRGEKTSSRRLPFELLENIYGYRKRLFWIIRQIENYRNRVNKPKDKVKVLEIGCGTGIMITIPLASAGYNVLGTDLDKKSIELANSVNPYRQARFVCKDITELHSSYDIIILSEVLEHLKAPEELLSESRNKLSEDGILIITVPNGYGWFELEQFLWDRLKVGYVIEALKISDIVTEVKGRLIGKQRDIRNFDGYVYPSTLSSSPHVQRFTIGKIKGMAMRNGFSISDLDGSTLIAGKFSNLLLTGFEIPMKINNRLGTTVKPLASGFYLCCRKN